MARGSRVVITSPPMGTFREFIVKTGQTFYPGMVVEIDAAVTLVSGRHTARIFGQGADGEQPSGAHWVVTEMLQGMTGGVMSQSIAAGERVMCYAPMPGDELNLLIANISGTADDHAKGEKLIVDTGTGKLIATTGTPEREVAVLLETITDPTADTLAWCQWSGN